MAKLIYEDLVKENKDSFISKVKQISDNLGFDPNWLMQVMKIESNISASIQNRDSSATGLIQFMPKTAIGLGTTIDKLKNMSNVQQLDYVYKYFLPNKGKIKSYTDLYLSVFFPVAIGKPDNYVLQTDTISAGSIAKQNAAWDLNKDKQVTKGEVTKAVTAKIPDEFKSLFTKGIEFVKNTDTKTLIIFSALSLISISLGVYYIYKKKK